MSNPRRTALAAAGVIVLAAGGVAVAYACGMFFPMQLLDDRAATLAGTPSNSFAYEASHLVPLDSVPKLPAPASLGGDAATLDTDAVLRKGLSAPQLATLARMAQAADGDAARALGEGLPEAQRLEAAASVDLALAGQACETAADGAAASGAAAASAASVAQAASAASSASPASATRVTQPACADPDAAMHRAVARLEAVLALPPAQSAQVGPIAADQLAQLASGSQLQCGAGVPAATCATSIAAAHRAYARIRAVTARGAPDPLGLAVASYGDEALLDLRDAGTGEACNWLSFVNATACAAAIPAPALKRAIGLYAQQAAHGSNTGLESLAFIAGWALGDTHRAAALIDDAVAQRLLVGYALARVGDVVAGDPASTSEYRGEWDNTVGPSGFPDAARGAKNTTPNPQLAALTEAIRARGLTHVGRTDQLAALAYRVGRYDLAATLLDGQQSALAHWVRAKLALRRGDTAEALREYAAAAQAFPGKDPSLDAASAQLVNGERGVLTLSRGQYVEAMGLFYAAANADTGVDGYNINYAGDLAYLAERVLSTDELKTFVDAHASASPAPAPTLDTAAQLPPLTTADTLRYLLARRLVRDGRIDESLPYFPRDGDPRYNVVNYDAGNKPQVRPSTLRALAKRYGELLHTAQHAWFDTTRAQAWFEAATLAKRQGMELMGYEQEPDYTDVGGSQSGGSGRNRTDLYADYANRDPNAPPGAPVPMDTPAERVKAALPGPLVTDGERTRYVASESRPYRRFHYRALAADDIQHAADLLPPRSQAYAAVLCQGTEWIANDDPARARHFYEQYVAHGAYVDFGPAPFGVQCVAPDFHGARVFHWVQARRAVVQAVRAHRKRAMAVGAALVLLIAGGVAWWVRRRARRAE